MRRSVILFPNMLNLDAIQLIREKYDPLARCIKPHITIVFPLESDLTASELQQHFTDALQGMARFRIELAEITGDQRNGYLFLNVKKGNDQIIELHDRLYSGLLKNYYFNKLPYVPHLTVGMVSGQAEFDRALDYLKSFTGCYETVIDQVYVETIGNNDESIIEFCQQLV